jgi:hypothetical protein
MSRDAQGKRDIEHFLRLAAAQVKHRREGIEGQEPYSERINRMRLLEELIREQVPDENPRRPTRASR